MLITLDASFWPQTAEGWTTLIIAVVTLLPALAGLVITIIKLCKATKALIKSNKFKQVLDAISAAAVEAEKTHKTGAEKKEIVIAAVKAYAAKIGCELTEDDLSNISIAIDKAIGFHNEMDTAAAKK